MFGWALVGLHTFTIILTFYKLILRESSKLGRPDPRHSDSLSCHLGRGQSTTLAATATNGTCLASSYAWYGLPMGCSSTSNLTLTCVPTRAGNYNVSVSIKDSNGMMVYSPAFSLVVSPSLGAVVVSVSRTTLDIGQPLTISANEAGSTGIYTLTWSGLPSGCLNGGVGRGGPPLTGNLHLVFTPGGSRSRPARVRGTRGRGEAGREWGHHSGRRGTVCSASPRSRRPSHSMIFGVHG